MPLPTDHVDHLAPLEAAAPTAVVILSDDFGRAQLVAAELRSDYDRVVITGQGEGVTELLDGAKAILVLYFGTIEEAREHAVVALEDYARRGLSFPPLIVVCSERDVPRAFAWC